MDSAVTNVKVLDYLVGLVGKENVLIPATNPEKTQDYLKDMGDYPSDPLVIVQPSTTERVSKIVSFARSSKIPVTARGTGTSLTGATSSHGGIVIDFSKHMNRVLAIDTVNW